MFQSVVMAALAVAPAAEAPSLPVTALAVAPGDAGVLVASQAGVRLRSPDGRESLAVATRLDQVHALALSPDGRQLAVAGGTPGESGGVEIWSWPGKSLLRTLDESGDLVYALAWGPNGAWLAAAGADRSVRVWDAASGQRLRMLAGHSGPVLALAVSPDGRWLCSGSADQTVRVWDVTTWTPARTLDNHTGAVRALAFRPGGDSPALLASAGADATVRLWHPATGRMLRIVRHPAAVVGLAWTADGARLASAAADGRLRQATPEGEMVADAPLGGRPTVLIAAGTRFLVGLTAGAVVAHDAKSAPPP